SRPERTPLQRRARNRGQDGPVRHRTRQGAGRDDPRRVPAAVSVDRAGRLRDDQCGGIAPRTIHDRRYGARIGAAAARRGQEARGTRPWRVNRPGRRLAGLLVIGFALVACGKKGPPVPPEVRLPVPPAGLRASIDENVILVSWTNPGTRIDG